MFENYENFGDSRALRRVLSLASEAGLRVVQEDTVEEGKHEEWEAERVFLSSRGEPTDAQATRLDFFGGNAGNSKKPQLTRSNYLGYALVRPGAYRSVLEAMVKPPEGSHGYLNSSCSVTETIRAGDENKLFRSRLDGIHFVEQDGEVGCCAHACVRMASLLLAERFGTPRLTFPEISKAAGVGDGTEGLTYDQMLLALEAADCNVHAYKAGGKTKAGRKITMDQLIYYYNECGFPIIVGIRTEGQPHAVLVIGHEFDPNAWWPEAEREYYPSFGKNRRWANSALWNSNFIVQDDNFGPYMNAHRTFLRETAVALLIPVPNAVPMVCDPLVAEATAASVLFNRNIRSQIQYDSRSPWQQALEVRRGPVLRTTICQEHEFRDHIQRSKYPPEIKTLYEHMPLPRWIYTVEISVMSMYGSLLKLGEITIDPSKDIASDNELVGEAVLSLHTPGLFWRSPMRGDQKPEYVDGDKPTPVMKSH